jgi:hypothetical protein
MWLCSCSATTIACHGRCSSSESALFMTVLTKTRLPTRSRVWSAHLHGQQHSSCIQSNTSTPDVLKRLSRFESCSKPEGQTICAELQANPRQLLNSLHTGSYSRSSSSVNDQLCDLPLDDYDPRSGNDDRCADATSDLSQRQAVDPVGQQIAVELVSCLPADQGVDDVQGLQNDLREKLP